MMKRLFSPDLVRPFFYAVMLVLGMSVAFDQLEAGRDANYFTVIVIVSFILLVEIYSSWIFQQSYGHQTKIKVHSLIEGTVEWGQHTLVPLLTYYGGAVFMYYNRSQDTRWVLYLLNLFVFTILFYNLRSYHAKDTKEEKVTSYIYDLLRLYLVFLVNNALINMINEQQTTLFIAAGVNFLMGLSFNYFGLNKRSRKVTRNLIVCGLIGAVMFVISLASFSYISFSELEIAFLNTMLFYVLTATLHHYIEKTINLEVIIEYLIVMILITNIFINIK